MIGKVTCDKVKRRVADIIFDILLEHDITDCFAVVGGGAMHLDNALALNNGIRKTFNHHEQACAMAAEAYARYSGRMAAVCVTSGPGATNAITGVMGCWQDSLPMIVLSGQVRYEISVAKSGLPLRYRGIQEFEIIPSVKNMTKYAVMLTDPLAVKREVNRAIDIAMNGRRGPVWLDVPLDIQSAIVEEDEMYPVEPSLPAIAPIDEDIRFIAEKLCSAKRPCILAGNGIANSHNIEPFRAFAEKIGIPVIGAFIAADAMYRDYPLYFGMSGTIGPRTGNYIVQNADVILSVGCGLGFGMTGFAQEYFAPNAYIIAVDVDPYEMKKPGLKIDRAIISDLSEFFKASEKIDFSVKADQAWVEYCNKLVMRFSPFEGGAETRDDERVCSYRFWKVFEQYESEDSIAVLGNNTANSAKLQIGVKRKEQRIIANKNCGSMGYDLPASVGAALASGKDTVCITGDGSIMMNLQELQTIRHYDLPVNVIVFNNGGYNAIRQTSRNFFNGVHIGCTPETGISFPSFEDVAHTFGFDYIRCETNADLDYTLKAFFNSGKRVLLEIMQRLDDPVTPKVMSRMMDDGTMCSPSLEDMAPFISKQEHDELMLW